MCPRGFHRNIVDSTKLMFKLFLHFTFLSGQHCCKTGKEALNPSLGEKCDESEISFNSVCCEGDQGIECPSPPCKNNCMTISFDIFN